MNPKTRLNIVLSLCAVAAVSVAATVMYFELRQRAVAEVSREANLHMEAAQALRRYTVEHVRPLLTGDSSRFYPESVPSFSAVTAMRQLHEHYPGVNYREVALNPTNPANLATGVHADLVNDLRATQAGSLQRQVTEADGEVLYLAKPLRVASAACLVCHSTPAAAPQAMRVVYGDEHGYGWQLNEVIGAQVVRVPMAVPLAQARQALWQFLLGASLTVLTVVLALNAMLRQVLLNPMTTHQSALRKEAREDALTGALNRRGFMEQLSHTLRVEGAATLPVSLVMMDVDHFKQINDTRGHACGDAVLQGMAAVIQPRIRRTDQLGRLGGDEFALLLPGTPPDQALEVAQALLTRLQSHNFHGDVKAGFSMGVATCTRQCNPDELLAAADRALYAAKEAGRNQVKAAPPA
jgi:diguanylate cyclase (GGDEF)-like protein